VNHMVTRYTKQKISKSNYDKAFTIVELLIVIVIIGILATIVIVAFSGVSRQATISTLLSDLNQASQQLKADQVINGTYPGTAGAANNGVGLKSSGSTTYQYTVNNGTNPQTFCLTATNGSLTYYINSNGIPTEGLCPGHSAPIIGGAATVWSMISVGGEHACAIGANQLAYCWGGNANGGEIGDNSSIDRLTPVPVYTAGVLNGRTILKIASGFYHTCAVASDNQAYCWGNGQYGRLGNGGTSSSLVPVAVNTSGALSGLTINNIAGGSAHTCATASNGNAYCWGIGNSGQLGNNSLSGSLVPVAVDTSGVLSGKTIIQISSSYQHTCVVASDNQAYCWGSAWLGNNSSSTSSVPVAVDTSGVLSGLTINSISAGRDHTCAVASNGNAYCWGQNANGQLGNNSVSNSLVPVAVSMSGILSGLTIGSISAGYYHTCAIASNNQVYCWGSGTSGKLGNNTTSGSLVPVAVNTSGVLSGLNINSISAQAEHTCAIASGGPAFCWGIGAYGRLGNNSESSSSVPVQVVTPSF
jgi:prepilin-type N-terminal cleavage/methylation domain-containing protein